MSTPHIEHFVDERGNFIYRAEFEGSFLSKDEVKELAKYVSGVLDENAKLRELVADMWFGLYCPTEPTDGCPQCPFNRDGECFFEQRMRELGMDAELGVDA